MRFLNSFLGRQLFLVSSEVLLVVVALGCGATGVYAQQTPAPEAKSEANRSSSAAQTASPAEKTPVPGLDPKTGIPYYEEIQEDWSSLEIGVSKLEPQPPLVGAIDEEDKFTRVMVRVQWRPGDPIDLWIMLPKGVKKPPVVLYLYGANQEDNRFRENHWCERVTSGGVAAVGFVSAFTGQRFHDRPMKQWFVSELQEALGSTVHDVKFILDYLANSGQVDMDHVGMFGEGSGGTIAILAAAADPRIKAVDALDPWGDWPDFLAKSSVVAGDPNHDDYVKPEFLKKVANLDPVKWLPQLKVPIRIQQVRDNDLTPLECKEAIKAAAPKQAEVLRFAAVMDLGKREGQGRLFDWIKDRLREPVKPGTQADPKVSVAQKVGSSSPTQTK